MKVNKELMNYFRANKLGLRYQRREIDAGIVVFWCILGCAGIILFCLTNNNF